MADHNYRRRRANIAAGPVPEGGRGPAEVRNRQVLVRLSDAEYARLRERADAAQMSVPRLLLTQHEGRMPAEAMAVRGRLLDLYDALANAHREVKRVGTNVNQIAVAVNRGAVPAVPELAAAAAHIEAVLDRLAAIAEHVDEAVDRTH